MPQERMFYAPDANLPALGEELAQWLRGRRFETQLMPLEAGGLLVQGRQEEGWKAALGMALATNVALTRIGPNLKVETGQGKWLDKAVVGAVGVLLLWPALIPAAIGAWQQSKLPEEIFDRVSAFLARQPQRGPAAAASAGEMPCPHCGKAVKQGAKFCEHCGQPLPQEAPAPEQPRFCANCGAALGPGARFCSACGKAVES